MFALNLLRPAIVPSLVKQTSTIIFLHGLGDTGQSWVEILPLVRPPHAKIICPNAPVQCVTLNQGIAMPAWFDLRPLDQPKDEFGIKSAAAAIEEVIQEEIDQGIPANKIVLGGFSQGGAVALYTGLTMAHKLAGILALSTWLPLDKAIPWDKIQTPPVLQCHGEEDGMIAMDRAMKTANALSAVNKQYTLKTYKELGHAVDYEFQLNDIKDFLQRVL